MTKMLQAFLVVPVFALVYLIAAPTTVRRRLWHVLLAHTRLYPRPTTAHNIAFDAIINAGLSRRFPGREYRGFFERLYPADEFPARLLRPRPRPP